MTAAAPDADRLAAVQDLLVEMAIDAGSLNARIDALQGELGRVRADRDMWRAAARRRRGEAA